MLSREVSSSYLSSWFKGDMIIREWVYDEESKEEENWQNGLRFFLDFGLNSKLFCSRSSRWQLLLSLVCKMSIVWRCQVTYANWSDVKKSLDSSNFRYSCSIDSHVLIQPLTKVEGIKSEKCMESVYDNSNNETENMVECLS